MRAESGRGSPLAPPSRHDIPAPPGAQHAVAGVGEGGAGLEGHGGAALDIFARVPLDNQRLPDRRVSEGGGGQAPPSLGVPSLSPLAPARQRILKSPLYT